MRFPWPWPPALAGLRQMVFCWELLPSQVQGLVPLFFVFCSFVFLVSESETKFYSPAFKPYVIHVAYKIFLPFGISGNNFHSYVYQIKQKYACYKHNYVQQKFNKNSRRTLRWDLDSLGLAHVLMALKPWPQLSLLTSLGKITNRLNHFSLAVGHY